MNKSIVQPGPWMLALLLSTTPLVLQAQLSQPPALGPVPSARQASPWSVDIGGSWSRPRQAEVEVALGSPVRLTGNSEWRDAWAGRLVLGREIPRQAQDASVPRPWARLEVEAWQEEGIRESFSLGRLKVTPDGPDRRSALFLNAMVPVWRSSTVVHGGRPQSSIWLGAGLGWGRLVVVSADTGSCGCLPAVSEQARFSQLKLQFETVLGEQTALVLQAAAVRVPGYLVDRGAFPVTRQSGETAVEAGLALRWSFR